MRNFDVEMVGSLESGNSKESSIMALPPLPRQLVMNGLRFMLRPIVRFCLRGNVGLNDFIHQLKIVYVEIGEGELKTVTRKINVSRLSLMTGVHRKDVTAIFREKLPPLSQTASLWARVMGQWEQDKRYRTSVGKPRVLSYEGDNNEFKELCERVSKNINSGTVLFELERIGALKKTPAGVKLVRKENRFSKDPEKGFELLAKDVDAQIDSVLENLLNPQKITNHHIRTEYDNISPKDFPKIRSWFQKEGRAFHKRARDFLSKFDRDIHPERAKDADRGRATLASFSLTLPRS